MSNRPEVYVVIEGLDAFDRIATVDEKVETALRITLNAAAKRLRTRSEKVIKSQINFPASYLRPSQGRLTVRRWATKQALQATVSGRIDATSLARFKTNRSLAPGKAPRGGKVGVRVRKGGGVRKIKRAFLMRLRNDNVGLAVRTDGSKPQGAYKPKEIGKNLWLLYGPSVDQALRHASDGEGVAKELTPEMLDFMNDEFDRQLDRLGVT